VTSPEDKSDCDATVSETAASRQDAVCEYKHISWRTYTCRRGVSYTVNAMSLKRLHQARQMQTSVNGIPVGEVGATGEDKSKSGCQETAASRQDAVSECKHISLRELPIPVGDVCGVESAAVRI
jgi:hypothetical protein